MSDISALCRSVLAHDAEATPGPWSPCGAPGCTCGLVWTSPETAIGIHPPDSELGQAPPADSAAASYYRTAAPRLAREVMRLQALVDEAPLWLSLSKPRDEATDADHMIGALWESLCTAVRAEDSNEAIARQALEVGRAECERLRAALIDAIDRSDRPKDDPRRMSWEAALSNTKVPQ